MIALQENKTKAVVAYLFIIIATIDDYAHIYSASLQFILFFGLPIAYWFFVKIGRFIVSLDCSDAFKYA